MVRDTTAGTPAGAAAAAALSLALLGAAPAQAKLVAPAFADFPVGPGPFASQAGGPRLADDFVPSAGGRIGRFDWWGSEADGPWTITLYANAAGEAARPDAPLASMVVGQPYAEPWDDDVFRYEVLVDDPAWALAKGQSYWLGVASATAGWTWALGDGVSEFGGTQLEAAVGAADGATWAPLVPASQLAFVVWPSLLPGAGSFGLMLGGLAAVAVAHRARARRG